MFGVHSFSSFRAGREAIMHTVGVSDRVGVQMEKVSAPLLNEHYALE